MVFLEPWVNRTYCLTVQIWSQCWNVPGRPRKALATQELCFCFFLHSFFPERNGDFQVSVEALFMDKIPRSEYSKQKVYTECDSATSDGTQKTFKNPWAVWQSQPLPLQLYSPYTLFGVQSWWCRVMPSIGFSGGRNNSRGEQHQMYRMALFILSGCWLPHPHARQQVCFKANNSKKKHLETTNQIRPVRVCCYYSIASLKNHPCHILRLNSQID